MKKIIVPVDFSVTSNNAAKFAVDLAAFYGAAIILYHSYDIPISFSEMAYPVFDSEKMQYAAIHELERLKASLVADGSPSTNIEIRAEVNVLEKGLIQLSDAINPSLIVIGLSGKNALTRLVVGSNTSKIIQHLKYPILVVPPMAEFIPIRKIGFACAYKQMVTQTPLQLLKKIVADFRAELHVMNIDFKDNNFDAVMVPESFWVYQLLKDLKPEYHNINSGDLVEGINAFIEFTKLDWIVVMPQKHSLMYQLFARSHTQQLLYHTSVPILCIHE